MKITIIKQTFLQYLFVLLGFSLLCYYIWFRILRDRAPQIIPFETSWISFILVLIICLTYLYIIIRIYQPKSPHPYVLKLLEVIKKIYYPLIVLDKVFKSNVVIKKIIIKLLFYGSLFTKKYKLYLYMNQNVFQLVFFHLPKFILLFVFCLDVFYFNEIKLFYYFIWLTLLPILFDYILYLIKGELENQIEYLEKTFYILVLSTGNDGNDYFVSPSNLKCINEFFDRYILHAKYFIEAQVMNLTFNYDLLKYDCIETGEAREIYAEEHHIQLPSLSVFEPRSDEISKNIFEEFHELMPMAINVTSFFENYKFIKQESIKTKKLNIMIMLMYLFCWVYIFLVSFVNFEVLVSCISNIIDNIEPFSQSNLEDGTEIHNQPIQYNTNNEHDNH